MRVRDGWSGDRPVFWAALVMAMTSSMLVYMQHKRSVSPETTKSAPAKRGDPMQNGLGGRRRQQLLVSKN